jgi:hypothetical protein
MTSSIIQMWSEFTGKNQLVAFDESGEVRTLYPMDGDQVFCRTRRCRSNSDGVPHRLSAKRSGQADLAHMAQRRCFPAPPRRVEIEKQEDVGFSSGGLHLAGTLISPTTAGRHPAIILVHGSGAEDREYMLPFARF